MIKKSITLNKSYISLLYNSNNNNNTSVIIRPGAKANTVIKPNINIKTDKGQQKTAISQCKRYLNNPKKISFDRLDLSLFLIHFTTSVKESRLFIRNKYITVNGKIITNINYILPDYAVIECKINKNIKNIITHSIKNFIQLPTNFVIVNTNTVIKTHNITDNILNLSLPHNLQINILKRGKAI